MVDLVTLVGYLLQMKKYFKEIGIPADVKYIDPTYMIRACRANASDGILCTVLGQNAVSFPLSLSNTTIHKFIPKNKNKNTKQAVEKQFLSLFPP